MTAYVRSAFMNCPMAGWENAMPVISAPLAPKGTGFYSRMPTVG